MDEENINSGLYEDVTENTSFTEETFLPPHGPSVSPRENSFFCQSPGSSVFGDADCGEPLEPQHIILDFTPLITDDEFSQKKVCDFWKYIEKRSDLKDMMVLPEKDSCYFNKSVDSVSPSVGKLPQNLQFPEPTVKPTTAVSMLRIVEDNGMIDRAFEAKMPQSRCTIGSHEYELSGTEKKRPCDVAVCPNAPCSDAKALCEELDSWDARHPKSMEPPGHPPSLSHSVMQRRVIT